MGNSKSKRNKLANLLFLGGGLSAAAFLTTCSPPKEIKVSETFISDMVQAVSIEEPEIPPMPTEPELRPHIAGYAVPHR